MSVAATSLPTDSLYKMLTIGGLVLIAGGIAIGWKAIDETQASLLALSEAESTLANASVPVQFQYKSICNTYREMEHEVRLALSGVNTNALNEFKGGQPSDFPQLAESLSASSSGGKEFGVKDAPAVSEYKSVDDWLKTAGKIRSHKQVAESFLTAPNLSAIGPETKAEVLEMLDSTQPMVAELEEKAVGLSAPQQLLDSAKLRWELANKRQRIIFGVALLLFCVGVAVFVRASVNWYQRVQRFEDAKLKHEASELLVDGPISLWANALWLAGPLVVASLLWCVLIWLAI